MIAFEGRAVTEPQLTRKVDATGHENKLPVAPCLRAWEPPRVCFLQVELGYELGQRLLRLLGYPGTFTFTFTFTGEAAY